jgi:hypothetical protein
VDPVPACVVVGLVFLVTAEHTLKKQLQFRQVAIYVVTLVIHVVTKRICVLEVAQSLHNYVGLVTARTVVFAHKVVVGVQVFVQLHHRDIAAIQLMVSAQQKH